MCSHLMNFFEQPPGSLGCPECSQQCQFWLGCRAKVALQSSCYGSDFLNGQVIDRWTANLSRCAISGAWLLPSADPIDEGAYWSSHAVLTQITDLASDGNLNSHLCFYSSSFRFATTVCPSVRRASTPHTSDIMSEFEELENLLAGAAREISTIRYMYSEFQGSLQSSACWPTCFDSCDNQFGILGLSVDIQWRGQSVRSDIFNGLTTAGKIFLGTLSTFDRIWVQTPWVHTDDLAWEVVVAPSFVFSGWCSIELFVASRLKTPESILSASWSDNRQLQSVRIRQSPLLVFKIPIFSCSCH